MYLNKVFLIGNLTRDPELRSLPSGAKVVNFGLATNRFWKDRQTGERKTATEFHDIVVFGVQAETAAKYLKKGSQVLVEGRIQTRSWDGKDGTKRYRTEVVADNVQFGGRSGGSGGGVSSGGASPAKDSGEGLETINMDDLDNDYPDADAVDIEPDEIPF